MLFSGPFANLRRQTVNGRWFVWTILSLAAGLLIPAMILISGVIATILNRGLDSSPIHFGRRLRLPLPEGLLELSPMLQLSWLVGFVVVLAAILAGLLWWTKLATFARSRACVAQIHRSMLEHGLLHAQSEGSAAQRARIESLVERELPALQDGLVAWWSAVPRVVLTLVGCLTVAVLVDVWLAMLAIVAAVIVWRFRAWLARRDTINTLAWELQQANTQLVEMVQQAPLLARLQTRETVSAAFNERLKRIEKRQAILDAHAARVSPLFGFASILTVSVIVLALGANRFGVPRGVGLPAAEVLGLSLAGAALAALRLVKAVPKIRRGGEAAAVIRHAMDSGDTVELGDRVGITGLRTAVELDNVTLTNNVGQEVLSSLTLRFEPKTLVAVLGTDSVATSALIELLLGFGKPSQGLVTMDGLPIAEIHPNSLSRQVFWIGQDGPIWHGTVRDNLLGVDANGGEEAMMEALRRAGIYEHLSELSDGLATVLSPERETLDGPTRYAIGVARALLRRPAVVVVQEPDTEETLADNRTLEALRYLSDSGSLVIMVPRRLESLRRADRVVLLNGNRFAGEGKHETLLASSDLYRHLNYLLFNPYRRSG